MLKLLSVASATAVHLRVRARLVHVSAKAPMDPLSCMVPHKDSFRIILASSIGILTNRIIGNMNITCALGIGMQGSSTNQSTGVP